MDWFRLKHSIRMMTIGSALERANYIKKHHVFRSMGDNCMVMFRKIPLYPQLISFGDNVWIASNVTFCTHDSIHDMLNRRKEKKFTIEENIGCIEIGDNCWIGTRTTILPNVRIASNTIVGAGTLVNKDIHSGVWAGVPAKYICSYEELIEKRRNSLKIVRDKNGITQSIFDECWENFEKIRKQ